MREVLVVLTSPGGIFGRTEMEILSAGRRLADSLGGALAAVALGPADGAFAAETFAYGADRILRVEHAALSAYQPETYLAALQHAYATAKSDVVLFASNTYGLELAPLFGYKIGASVTLDCIELKKDDASGGVRLTKPVYGGKANWLLVAKKAPVVAALRMRATAPLESQHARTGEIVEIVADLDSTAARSKIIERKVEESGTAKLEDARVIISGGRGLGGAEKFKILEELAKLLGGAVGASRAACDQGWVPASWQIGQTGKKVAPDLYLAVGISGASQHMVGCSGSKHIAAVNKDPKAPIFRAAEFGVVEDFHSFLPALMEALKQRKAG